MKLSSAFATALSTTAVALVTAFGFSSQAQGLTFSGNSSGKWGIPNPGSINTNPVYTGVDTNSFTWGESIPEDKVNFGTPPNQLTFDGNSFSADIDSLFKVGDLTYFNGTVPVGTNVDSVPLNLNLSLANPINLSEVFNFDFELVNTPNLAENTPEENADIVYVNNNLSNRSITIDGEKYILELTGFSQDNGNTNVSEFRVLEGDTTTAGIYAKITRIPAEKVPEPATISGLSLLGVYLASRRSKSLRGQK